MIKKIFPAEKERLNEVIRFVEAELERLECPMKSVMQISVVIEEIFVNVASYAYPEGGGDVHIEMGYSDEDNKITFCFRDRGIPFDPLARPDPDITLSAEEREIGGLGIYMMKRTMDDVSYTYENGENILRMSKKIKEKGA